MLKREVEYERCSKCDSLLSKKSVTHFECDFCGKKAEWESGSEGFHTEMRAFIRPSLEKDNDSSCDEFCFCSWLCLWKKLEVLSKSSRYHFFSFELVTVENLPKFLEDLSSFRKNKDSAHD